MEEIEYPNNIIVLYETKTPKEALPYLDAFIKRGNTKYGTLVEKGTNNILIPIKFK